jgi:hypothetical protein
LLIITTYTSVAEQKSPDLKGRGFTITYKR